MASFIDYLPVVTPDYSTALPYAPNFDVVMAGAYKQVVNDTDGGTRVVVTLKTTPDATIPLRFTGLTQTQVDALSDFYYNPVKAYGFGRSYKLTHPQTLEDYTVQNITEFTETAVIKSYGRYDVSFTVKILGTPT